ncbi:MAG: aldo/keto reductase [Candidatus Heimdallarchaeota archaeon]|nr:aldo/keto reductase [Candidatus Heimdallarchaeota archaeon]
MKYKTLGKTGIKVSEITLGMMSFGNAQEWMLELEEAKPIVERAIDAGINFFDTANVYSNGRSEEITGELLKEYREDVVIATKVRFSMGDDVNRKGLHRKHMTEQILASLDRLQTDFVDLYQIHRMDYSMDVEFIMRSLNQLIDVGLTLHIGASSMYTWEFQKLQYTAEKLGLEKFVSMQNHVNAIYQEEFREMIPYCIDQGVAVIPWSPLGRGFLSGKYTATGDNDYARYRSDPYLKGRYFHPNDFEVLEVIQEISKETELSVPQVSLSWLLNQKGVTSPILGVSKLEHLEEAIIVLESPINAEQTKRISDAYSSRPIIGHSYFLSDNMISDKNK